MASGKTLEQRAFSRYRGIRSAAQEPRETVVRDRSLRGKARRKARKEANKSA